MNELKPCPFCGERPKIGWLDENREDLVACHNDDCVLFSLLMKIEEWNTRADTDLLRRVKEAVGEMIEINLHSAEGKVSIAKAIGVSEAMSILLRYVPEAKEAQDDTD